MLKTILRVLGIITLLLIISVWLPKAYESFKEQYSDFKTPKTKVGLVVFDQVIKNPQKDIKYLTKYFKDPEIKAILLRLDSPGGYAGSSYAIYYEILNLKKEYPKPVVAFALNVCASAAYQIVCTADYIVSTPSAIIGSVGALLPIFKIDEIMEQYKVRCVTKKGGDFKTSLSPFSKMTPEEDAALQSLVNDAYQEFIEEVAVARKLSLNEASIWANGHIFTGRQALKLKLIDALGNETTATEKLKELAHVTGDIQWIRTPKKNLIQQVLTPEDEGDSDMFERVGSSIASWLFKRNSVVS